MTIPEIDDGQLGPEMDGASLSCGDPSGEPWGTLDAAVRCSGDAIRLWENSICELGTRGSHLSSLDELRR